MEKNLALATLSNNNLNWKQSYSGKVGCMCGCKGKYTDGLNQRLLKNAIALVESGEAGEIDVDTRAGYVYISNGNDTRCYAFYYEA